MLISKEKKFYKLILSIALPIAVQNLITFAVSREGGGGEASHRFRWL